MSSGEDHENPTATLSSSSSESESEEAVDPAEAAARDAPTSTRSVQVVSAAPRRTTNRDDGAAGSSSRGGSSSSESEEEEPSRGKSYLQSIRARKPKKKVYVKPDERSESSPHKKKDKTANEKEDKLDRMRKRQHASSSDGHKNDGDGSSNKEESQVRESNMSSGEDHENRTATSSSSSSESESEEAVDRGEPAQAAARDAPTSTRSVQVVSAAPRSTTNRDDSAEGSSSSGGSSSSESEEEEAEGPSRGKSYLQSIRARKPKKKVYVKPDERSESSPHKKKDKTADEKETASSSDGHKNDGDGSTLAKTFQRGVNVTPSQNNNSSSESSDDEESELDFDHDNPEMNSSRQALDMEEGVRRIDGRSESVFSRLNRYAGSFRVRLSKQDQRKLEEHESGESDPDDMTGVFELMSRESQPDILKKDSNFRRRANKAISTAIADTTTVSKKEEKSRLCDCFKRKEKEGEEKTKPGEKKKKKPPATQLSPQLQKASSQGLNMMKKLFFPALPHLLQDLWVFLEFGITMFAFIFGVISLDLSDGSKVFNIVYLTLTIVSVILAVIDCFLYFVQMGSCVECLKICYSKLKKRGDDGDSELLEGDDDDKKNCCRMSKEKKEKFNTYFELVRNLLSEALLYPLLICDLFDFIVGGVFRNVNSNDHLNFTLFVVGSLYLILSVYIMRMVLIVGVVLSLSRLPAMPNSSGSQGNNIRLLKQFSIHILLQVIIHALLIVSVALKIRHENPNFGDQDTIFTSSFLWINVVLGGLIPLVGILTFFVSNYYYMREFSISFWIEMMTMLQAPSFTDVVFPPEDGQSTEDLAVEFIKDSELKKVQKQFNRYKSPSWYTKFFFPVRLPLLITIGSLFVLGLFGFLASLILTQNPVSPSGHTVEVVLFDDIPLTVAFFVCALSLMAFNVKLVVLVLVFFAVCILSLLGMSVMVAIVLPFVILVYVPIGCCVACWQCCRGTLKEVAILSSPGPRVNYFSPA